MICSGLILKLDLPSSPTKPSLMKLITDFANFGVHLNHSPFGLGIPFVDKSLCTSLSVKVVPSLLIAYSSKRILKEFFLVLMLDIVV